MAGPRELCHRGWAGENRAHTLPSSRLGGSQKFPSVSQYSNVAFIIISSNHTTYIHGIYMYISIHMYIHMHNDFIMYTHVNVCETGFKLSMYISIYAYKYIYMCVYE